MRPSLFRVRRIALLLLLATFSPPRPTAFAQSAALTYQGSLTQGGLAVTDLHFFEFRLLNAATATLASGVADLSPIVLSHTLWKLGGNAGATYFLGVSDNQPLEFYSVELSTPTR